MILAKAFYRLMIGRFKYAFVVSIVAWLLQGVGGRFSPNVVLRERPCRGAGGY